MAHASDIRKTTEPAPKNSLGIGHRELCLLCDLLDRGDRKGASRNRVFARWPFRHCFVPVTLRHPGGSEVQLVLASRNLSRGGIAMLHNGFVHSGSTCKVMLPVPDGPPVEAMGTVTFCQHRHARLHEVGIRFENPVNIRRHLNPAVGTDLLTYERIAPESLDGRMLVVEDSAIDQRIFQHHLRETKLAIRIVPSVAKAYEESPDSFDLIFLDWSLPDGKGSQILQEFRRRGARGPVCFITADTAGLIAEGLWDPPNSWMLSKPFSANQLLQTVAEMLDDGKRLKTAGPSIGLDPAKRAAIEAAITTLEHVSTADDLAAAVDACLNLASCATDHGMRSLADAADSLITQLSDASIPFEKHKSGIRELAKSGRGVLRTAA